MAARVIRGSSLKSCDSALYRLRISSINNPRKFLVLTNEYSPAGKKRWLITREPHTRSQPHVHVNVAMITTRNTQTKFPHGPSVRAVVTCKRSANFPEITRKMNHAFTVRHNYESRGREFICSGRRNIPVLCPTSFTLRRKPWKSGGNLALLDRLPRTICPSRILPLIPIAWWSVNPDIWA